MAATIVFRRTIVCTLGGGLCMPHTRLSSLPTDYSKKRSSVSPSSQNSKYFLGPLKNITNHKSLEKFIVAAKQLSPRHRTGVGKIKLKEGETLFMKMYSKDEHDLKAKQHVFALQYLALGLVGSLVVMSDFFLFDILCLVSLAVTAGVANRVYHKSNTKNVLEIVLLPNNTVKVKTLTSYGGSKSTIHAIEDCNFSDLEDVSLVNGKEFKVLWPNSGMFLDEAEYEKYSLYEKRMRHEKYISPFAEIDRVQTSRNLFAKKERHHELDQDYQDFVKIDSKETLKLKKELS